MALAVPLSRFTPRVGGGSACFVRHQAMIHANHYHWILLATCALVSFIGGGIFLFDKQESGRFSFPGERVVARLLHLGLMIFSASVFLRQDWAFYGLICCLALEMVSGLLAFRPEWMPAAKQAGWTNPAVYLFGAVIFGVLFGTPMLLLIWLRPIFTDH